MKDIVQFLYEVKGELGKVVWPRFPSLVESTAVVMVLVAAFAVYLGIIDMMLVRIVQYIFRIYG